MPSGFTISLTLGGNVRVDCRRSTCLSCGSDVVTSETHDTLAPAAECVDYARGYYGKARDALQEAIVLWGSSLPRVRTITTMKRKCFLYRNAHHGCRDDSCRADVVGLRVATADVERLDKSWSCGAKFVSNTRYVHFFPMQINNLVVVSF